MSTYIYTNNQLFLAFLQTKEHQCEKTIDIILQHADIDRYTVVALSDIIQQPAKQQPRVVGVNPTKVNQIADEVLQRGLEEPILVEYCSLSRTYTLISGHHRLEAYHRLNTKLAKGKRFKEIPVIVIEPKATSGYTPIENRRRLQAKENSKHSTSTNHNDLDALAHLEFFYSQYKFKGLGEKALTKACKNLLEDDFGHLHSNKRITVIKKFLLGHGLKSVQEPLARQVSPIVDTYIINNSLDITKSGQVDWSKSRVIYGSSNGTDFQNLRKSLGELTFEKLPRREKRFKVKTVNVTVFFRAKINKTSSPSSIRKDRKAFLKWCRDFNAGRGKLNGIKIDEVVMLQQILNCTSGSVDPASIIILV